MSPTHPKDSKLWFAVQLYKRGVVTADEFAEAVSKQTSFRSPLGSVAIERGKLTANEVEAVCAAQLKTGGKRFGETAVEMGLLTAEEVDELLEAQAEGVPDLLEVFAQMGVLTRSQLDTAQILWGRRTDTTQRIDE